MRTRVGLLLLCTLLVPVLCSGQDQKEPPHKAKGGHPQDCAGSLLTVPLTNDMSDTLRLTTSKWATELVSVQLVDSLDVYMPLDTLGTPERGSIVLVPPMPPGGMSAFVMIKGPDGDVYEFLASTLTPHTGKLCVVVCKLRNLGSRQAEFRIGDAVFRHSDGVLADLAAVGTGQHAIAKMAAVECDAALEAMLSVDPGSIGRIMYVFAIDEEESELELCFPK